MIDLKTVDFGQLKQAAKAFNDCGLVEKLGLTPLRTVGVKKENIAKEFIRLIEVVADKEMGDDLPDEVTAMYNFCYSDEMDEDEKKELLLDQEEEEDDEVEEELDFEEDPEEDDEEFDEEEEEDEGIEDDEEEELPKPVSKPKKDKPKKDKPKKDKPKKDKPKTDPKPKIETEAKSKFGHILSKPTGQMDEMLEGGASVEKIIEVLGVEKKAVTRHFRRLKKKGFIITKKTSDDDSMSQIYRVSKPKK